ncbi:MAG: hypothetical protein KGD64_15245 [Candidatus Heimdallarchaeota archaeon]|nr:hypothetical protein [Candidatus Heimdallarchaeota archaeon]
MSVAANVNITWVLTSQGQLNAGTGGVYYAASENTTTEMKTGINIDIYLVYKLAATANENEQKLIIGNKYVSLLVNASADIFMPLQYRTATDDSATCRSTFPGPGYSPTLVFLLGAFKTSPSLGTDYIMQNTNNMVEQIIVHI